MAASRDGHISIKRGSLPGADVAHELPRQGVKALDVQPLDAPHSTSAYDTPRYTMRPGRTLPVCACMRVWVWVWAEVIFQGSASGRDLAFVAAPLFDELRSNAPRRCGCRRWSSCRASSRRWPGRGQCRRYLTSVPLLHQLPKRCSPARHCGCAGQAAAHFRQKGFELLARPATYIQARTLPAMKNRDGP